MANLSVVDITNDVFKLHNGDSVRASFVFEGARTIVCLIYSILDESYYLAKLNVETEDLSVENLIDVDVSEPVVCVQGGTLNEGFLDAESVKIGFRKDNTIEYWETVDNVKGPTYFFSEEEGVVIVDNIEYPMEATPPWVRANIAIGRYDTALVFLQNGDTESLSPTRPCTCVCGFVPIGERLYAVLFAGKSFQIFDFPYDPSKPSPQPPSEGWCTVDEARCNCGDDLSECTPTECAECNFERQKITRRKLKWWKKEVEQFFTAMDSDNPDALKNTERKIVDAFFRNPDNVKMLIDKNSVNTLCLAVTMDFLKPYLEPWKEYAMKLPNASIACLLYTIPRQRSLKDNFTQLM